MDGRSGGAAVEGLLACMRRTFAYQSKPQAQLLGELAMLMVTMTAVVVMTMMMMMIPKGHPRNSYDFL